MLSEYGQAVGPDAAQIIHPSFARQILSRAANRGGRWLDGTARVSHKFRMAVVCGCSRGDSARGKYLCWIVNCRLGRI